LGVSVVRYERSGVVTGEGMEDLVPRSLV